MQRFRGMPASAFSNAVGGIAAQTLFLALADIVYRKANLEHAAAEPSNLFQAVMLIILLSLPICAMAGPEISYFGVHPASILLFLAYVAGTKMAAHRQRRPPMWKPVQTTRHP